MSRCTFGKYEERETGSHTCGGSVTARESLSQDEVRLLKLRSGCKRSLKYVCQNHKSKLLVKYAGNQRVCCLQENDPYGKHSKHGKKQKTRNLKEITLQIRDKGKTLNLSLIPGQKLCVSCHVHFHSLFERKKSLQTQTAQTEQETSTTEASSRKREREDSEKEVSALPLSVPKRIALDIMSSPSIPSSPLHGSQSSGGLSRQGSMAQAHEDEKDVDSPETLDTLNSWLKAVGKNPVSLRKVSVSYSYLHNVLNDIREVLVRLSGGTASDEIAQTEKKAELYDEMICQLKDFLQKNKGDKKAQMLALSILPKSLSISKIQEDLEVSRRRIRRVKEIVEEKGILSYPEPKQGRRLPEETETLVRDYFFRMDVSRELPGKKDYISVRVGARRVLKRKRLVLGTLSQLHKDFLDEHKDVQISVSKFASLRPRECVLAGSPGTHLVCVCTYHQNPKLMFRAAGLHKIDGLKSVSDCLKFFLCPEPTESCHLRSCEKCPNGLELQEAIELYFAENMIDSIKYNQWKSTDRSEMEAVTSTREKFLDDFLEQMEQLVSHAFIADQQASFYREKLNTLEEGEVVVNADFAENYTYVIQESSQSHYFSNQQATVHPFMCYAKQGGSIIKLPYVVVSDYTVIHDTACFSSFQARLIDYLKSKLGSVKKIYYFSDGSASQYKNRKTVANIWFHHRDYDIAAEWHFFATSHGKCACDGLGGTVKRVAYLHSLRATKPEDQITNVSQLYNFCKLKIRSMEFALITVQDVERHLKAFELRLQTAEEIEGIKSCHTIIPSETSFSILLKVYSNATGGTSRMISARELEISFSDVRGFIIYADSTNSWKLAYVHEKEEASQDMKITPLKETNQKYSYEFEEDEVTINHDKVLLLVEPRVFKRGQVYKLLVKDIKAANECLKSWSSRSR